MQKNAESANISVYIIEVVSVKVIKKNIKLKSRRKKYKKYTNLDQFDGCLWKKQNKWANTWNSIYNFCLLTCTQSSLVLVSNPSLSFWFWGASRISGAKFQTFEPNSCIHSGVCRQYLWHRWLWGLYSFHSGPIVPALHSGALCDTCRPVQVNWRRWMVAASEPHRSDFWAFFLKGSNSGGFLCLSFPLSFSLFFSPSVLMSEELLLIACLELTVIWGPCPKANLVKCTASLGMDALLHR